MKTWVMLACLALGLGSALAHDPPGYARAFIGHVIGLPPDGVVVQGLDQSQLHPQPAPGVDHMCFMTGTALIKGLKTPYKVGDKIEIMVTEGDGTYLFADPAHPQQIEIWNLLSESLAFPVDVDWDPAHPASGTAPATPPSGLSAGSIDDPIPGSGK